jgi:hypothetical protein
MRSLTGDFCGPRARSLVCSDAGNTAEAGRICLISAMESSRTSPCGSINGLDFGITTYLTRVGLAKADDADAISCLGEAQNVQAPMKEAKGNIASLAVVDALVYIRPRGLEVEIFRLIKRQVAFFDVALIFGRVIGDMHSLIVCTIMPRCPALFYGSLTPPGKGRENKSSQSDATYLRPLDRNVRLGRVGEGVENTLARPSLLMFGCGINTLRFCAFELRICAFILRLQE